MRVIDLIKTYFFDLLLLRVTVTNVALVWPHVWDSCLKLMFGISNVALIVTNPYTVLGGHASCVVFLPPLNVFSLSLGFSQPAVFDRERRSRSFWCRNLVILNCLCLLTMVCVGFAYIVLLWCAHKMRILESERIGSSQWCATRGSVWNCDFVTVAVACHWNFSHGHVCHGYFKVIMFYIFNIYHTVTLMRWRAET